MELSSKKKDFDSMTEKSSKIRRFPFTPEGCKEALAYLKEIGKEYLIEKQLSTDGYTITELAENFYEERNQG